MSSSIAILGEYSANFDPHRCTNEAISHSCNHLGIAVDWTWIPTDEIDETLFEHHAGIWVAPGSPYKNREKTLRGILTAREQMVPCLGTCGGFQHIIVEYARNVLGHMDAEHGENDPYASKLFVTEPPLSRLLLESSRVFS